MKKSILLLLIVFAFACKKKTTEEGTTTKEETKVTYSTDLYKPNALIYGSNAYTQIKVGDYNCPIILSSPHDGTVSPAIIPDRTNPDATTVRDINVSDLTEKIAVAIFEKTGMRPHVIQNNLSRLKMDPNRSLAEAYLTHSTAITAWEDYQNFLKIASQIVKDNVGKGLYLDMHGHGHDKDRIEVGYLLTKAQVNMTDADINYLAAASSIYSIAKSSNLKFSELMTGDYAFGTLLANEGCPAVPSKTDPRPNDDLYFNGGYCTLAYGSKDGGNISAIQLETNGNNFRNTPAQRTKSAGAVANAIINYYKKHFGVDLLKKP